MKSTQLAPETERVLSTEEQQVIEKLCTDYKENLTKRFKEILDHGELKVTFNFIQTINNKLLSQNVQMEINIQEIQKFSGRMH